MRYFEKLEKLALFSLTLFMFMGAFMTGAAHADTVAASKNWSGYIATGSGYTAVGATWVVPTVSTTIDPSADATWVGIGGVLNSDLIQSGTQAIVQNGQVTYQAWVELLPQALQPITLNVKPGDSVTVALNQTTLNQWHLSFKNNTTGADYEKDISYTSSMTSAEWVEEKPSLDNGGSIALDMFTPVKFTNAYAVRNGANKTISQNNAVSIGLYNNQDVAVATPSALGTDGASFTVTRSSASSTTTSSSSSLASYSYSSSGSQQFVPPWKRAPAAGSATSTTINLGSGGGHRIHITIQRYTIGSGGASTSSMQLSQEQLFELLQNLMNRVYTKY